MLTAFGVLLLFASVQVGALVELAAPSDCDAAVADFQARVSGSVVGSPSNRRRAHVLIERRGARYRVEIRTQGDAARRTKRISTASCEEAVSTAIAVLALALSEPAAESRELAASSGEPAAESGEPVTSSETALEAVYEERARPSLVDTASSTNGDEPTVAPRPLRLALRAGIDAGTLTSATGFFGALATLPAGPFEWRALVAYGLPSVEERIDPGIAELRREHFLLVDLGGCYGLGDRIWLAACAAGELNVIQRARVHDDVADERTSVRVSGVLAAHFAYRGSNLQPELELAAAAAALGAGDAGPLAFRASLGLGLQF